MKKSQLKTFAAALFFMALGARLFAKESNLHVSLETDATVRFASQGEYVFVDVDSGGRRKLSYLSWEQKPLFMPEAKLCGGWKNLYVLLSAKTALPAKCGTVYDSDWLNVEKFPNCADEYASIKTNYTQSDCLPRYYYEFGAQISYDFKVADSISFSPFVQLTYTHSMFSAKDGSGSYYNTSSVEQNGYYGNYDDAESSYDVEMSGEVLRLERVMRQSWLGGRVNMGLSPKVDMGFSMAVNLFTFVDSLDSHLLTGAYYLDEFAEAFGGIRAGVDFSYKFSPKNTLIFALQGTAIQTLEGSAKSTTRKNAGYSDYTDCSGWEDGKYYKYTSGFDFSALECTLGYRHTFK